MAKEFIVNDRKLATVECNIRMFDCPVFQTVFDMASKERPLFATTIESNAGIRMEVMPEKVCALKEQIMNLCFDCNVKAR